MFRLTLSLIFLSFFVSPLCAQTGLFPVVKIATVDEAEPTCSLISAPAGCFGTSITDVVKVNGSLSIEFDGKTIYDSKPYVKDVSGMTIKVRGNTSATQDQKPFKIKLQKKADLLCRTSSSDVDYRDKEWLLLSPSTNMIKLKVGLYLNQLLGMSYTPSYRFVEVVMNGDYRGVYILAECVKRSDTRVDIDKDGGCIVERDAYWWNEDLSFSTNFFEVDNSYRWTFKYPDSQDVSDDLIADLQSSINILEAMISNSLPLDDVVDLQSMATWLLGHDIFGSWDSGGSNIYIARKSAGAKFFFPTLWDFDSSYQMYNSWGRIHTSSHFYFNVLFGSQNESFLEAYVNKWNSVNDWLFDDVLSFLNEYKTSTEAINLAEAIKLTNQRWDSEVPSVNSEISTATEWFSTRKEWLSEAIAPYSSLFSPTHIPAHNIARPYAIRYSISGSRVDDSHRGLCVENGRLVLR